MEDSFDELQALLRNRRQELPPPEYFDQFLVEFHRRQRVDLVRRPIWRLALDRLEGAFGPVALFAPRPAVLACAGSFAAVVLSAGLLSSRGHLLSLSPGSGEGRVAAAVTTSGAPAPAPAPAGTSAVVAAATSAFPSASSAFLPFRTAGVSSRSSDLYELAGDVRLSAGPDASFNFAAPPAGLAEALVTAAVEDAGTEAAATAARPGARARAAAVTGAGSAPAYYRPRYVLDSRPARYEARPASF